MPGATRELSDATSMPRLSAGEITGSEVIPVLSATGQPAAVLLSRLAQSSDFGDLEGRVDSAEVSIAEILAREVGDPNIKAPVDCATTGPISLSGEQTIDGVLTNGSRVLVKNQVAASGNGIWISAAGAWSRSSDMDSSGEIPWASAFVEGGDQHRGKTFLVAQAEVDLGTDDINWTKVEDLGFLLDEIETRVSRLTGVEIAGRANEEDRFHVDSLEGAYAAASMALSSQFEWSVNAGGRLLLDPQNTFTTPVVFWAGHTWERRTRVDVTCEVVCDDTTGGSVGPCIAFGTDETDLQIIIYTHEGNLAVLDSAAATIESKSGSAQQAQMAFSSGDIVSLRAIMEPDGSGLVVATNASGASVSWEVFGIPPGRIWPAWRRWRPGTIRSFRVDKTPASEETETMRGVRTKIGFSKEDFKGFYSASGGVDNAGVVWTIVGADVARVNNTQTGVLISRIRGVRSIRRGQSWEFTARGAIQANPAGGSSAGFGFCVGDDRVSTGPSRCYLNLENGFLGATNNAGSSISGQYVINASMAADIGDDIEMALRVFADGTGEYIVTNHTKSLSQTIELTDVPEGSVYYAMRSPFTADMEYLQAVPLSKLAAEAGARVTALEANLGLLAPLLLETSILPDFPLNRDNATDGFGFTVTGADRFPLDSDSIWAGLDVLGNDGRLHDDASPADPYDPNVHITDGHRILYTIELPWDASVQGVAVDTLASPPTVWIGNASGGTVRNYHVEGMSQGAEEAGDRMTLASLGVTANANGVAFDPNRGSGRGALWVGDASTGATLIDCDPSASPRVLGTITFGRAADQFHLLPDLDLLLYSHGGNGEDGEIWAYNLTNGTEALLYTLEGWQAAEGFILRRDIGEVHAYMDGFFHKASRPQVNARKRYRAAMPE